MKSFLMILATGVLLISEVCMANVTQFCESYPLTKAILAGDEAQVKFEAINSAWGVNYWCSLEEGSPDPRVQPIYIAVSHDNLKVTEMLIQNGADVNSVYDSVLAYYWPTALEEAVQSKHLNQAALLLEHGAKFELQTRDGRRHLAILAWIIDNYTCSKLGEDFLIETAKLFMAHKIDLNDSSFNGNTALSSAKACSFGQLSKFLTDHGAKR